MVAQPRTTGQRLACIPQAPKRKAPRRAPSLVDHHGSEVAQPATWKKTASLPTASRRVIDPFATAWAMAATYCNSVMVPSPWFGGRGATGSCLLLPGKTPAQEEPNSPIFVATPRRSHSTRASLRVRASPATWSWQMSMREATRRPASSRVPAKGGSDRSPETLHRVGPQNTGRDSPLGRGH